MTGLERPVVRRTAEIDHVTRKPFVVRLESGGRLVKVKTFGSRTWFSVTVKQLYQLAVQTAVNERARQKRLEREARRKVTRERHRVERSGKGLS